MTSMLLLSRLDASTVSARRKPERIRKISLSSHYSVDPKTHVKIDYGLRSERPESLRLSAWARYLQGYFVEVMYR
tara:strand:+ start:1537 stop:1761 length:225 start_codon:yes stop_codon:yes gene_type:complete